MNLEELLAHIKSTVPAAKNITNIRNLDDSIRFHWQQREFIVKTTLAAMEVKNNTLYITGASLLMSEALTKRSKNEKILASVCDLIKQSEEMMANPLYVDRGMVILRTVKQTLCKLINKKKK